MPTGSGAGFRRIAEYVQVDVALMLLRQHQVPLVEVISGVGGGHHAESDHRNGGDHQSNGEFAARTDHPGVWHLSRPSVRPSETPQIARDGTPRHRAQSVASPLSTIAAVMARAATQSHGIGARPEFLVIQAAMVEARATSGITGRSQAR